MLRRMIALSALLGTLALSAGCVLTGAGYYPYDGGGYYYQGYYYDPYYPYFYTPYVYPYPFVLGGSIQFNLRDGGHGFRHGGMHR